MFELRPYQQKLIDDARAHYGQGRRSVLMCLPTGGGKTVTASTVVHGAAGRRNRVWWLTHRRELASQASQTFYDLGIPHGTIQGGYVSDPHALVQVASIQTIVRRLDKLPAPSLIVFDECHHMGAGQWQDIFVRHPAAKVLGLTATPWRLDGKGLGPWFEAMVLGPSVADLIGNGSLSPYRLFAPTIVDLAGVKTVSGDYSRGDLAKLMDTPKIVGDAIKHYKDLCPGRRAVVFAAGVEASKHLALQFRDAGVPAEHVDGEMSAMERDAAVARFRAGETLVLSNADLFGEGFDVPAIEAVILLRPTKSLSLSLQQMGRALRPAPGKDCAIILDHAGNSLRHGLPDDDRVWDLADRAKVRKKDDDAVRVTRCEACFSVHRPAPVCPFCGHRQETVSRKTAHVDGELVEVTAADRQAEVRQAKTLDELKSIATDRGYKPGWADHVWHGRQARRAKNKVQMANATR